jgi:N-acetylmuramic acid 6-phosphate etherase
MAVLPGEHRALMSELEHLISEERNPNTMEIDLLPTAEVLRAINREDRSVPDAVGKVIAEIALAPLTALLMPSARAGGSYIWERAPADGWAF